MDLRVRRIYESPDESDGRRIFVDRLWARGLSKEKSKLDLWIKEIAPTTELRKWYGHDPEKFEEFRRRYFEELDANPKAEEFANRLAGTEGTVTLLCGAKDVSHSNAAVLKEWLERRIR